MTDFYQSYINAGDPSISCEQVQQYAYHSNHRVRMRVAENPGATTEVLSQLGEDSHADVRIAVAANPLTPLQVTLQLAQDYDPTVRYGIAENYGAPPAVLSVLSDDENPYVRCRAIRTLNKLLLDALNQNAHPRAQALPHHISCMAGDRLYEPDDITRVC